MDNRAQERLAVLQHFGASSPVAEEILTYDADLFHHDAVASVAHFPLPDETFVADWERYARELNSGARFDSLADRLVQLSFPIQLGISETTDYIAATRRGADVASLPSATGIRLERSRDIRVFIHPTWAGRIPIVIVPRRADFVSIVRAFSARNEPLHIPDSMGACMISGYNNLGRLRNFREQWQRVHSQPISIQTVQQHKEFYQDRFLILSDGCYSGVPAARIGVPESNWLKLALIIRREHECAHYFTRRVLRSMRNYLIDEIIADYCGILAASGRFRADWLLAFLGLDTYPHVRDEGRLHNYRGSPALGDEAFTIVQKMVVAAAENLDRFHRLHCHHLETKRGNLLVLLTLTSFTLEDLASNQAGALLATELQCKVRDLSIHLQGDASPSIDANLENRDEKSAANAGCFGRS
jgi:hypothetical protein